MHEATRDITAQYALGPRGAWILALIDGGRVYPLNVTNVLCTGRSLIPVELALTALGAENCRLMRTQLCALLG